MTAVRAGSPNELETPGGILRAPEVVLATNAALTGWTPASRNLTNFGSYVVLTEPAPELSRRSAGRAGRRSSTGGCSSTTSARRTTGACSWAAAAGRSASAAASTTASRATCRRPRAPRRGCGACCPGSPASASSARGAGRSTSPPTTCPFFRTKPGTRIHYGAGYSGHGVGPSWLGGRILASLALGADDEWTRLPLATRRRAAPAAGAVPACRRRPRPLGDHGLRGGRGGGPPPAARRESGSRAAAAARDGAGHPLSRGRRLPPAQSGRVQPSNRLLLGAREAA